MAISVEDDCKVGAEGMFPSKTVPMVCTTFDPGGTKSVS